MTPHAFEVLFRPSIRVLFDWDRLKVLGLQISDEVTAQSSEMSTWFAPWYATGELGDDYLIGGAAFRFQDVVDNPTVLPVHRLTKIKSIADTLMACPQALLVAIYDFGAGSIVLDGNHRVAARLLHATENPVLAVKVKGSIDAEILPDLANVSYCKQKLT